MKKQHHSSIIVALCFATSLMAQLVFSAGAYAATDTGTITTARKKLYYEALSGCVSSDNYRSYRYTELFGFTVGGPYVRYSSISGSLFLTGAGDSMWSKNLIPGYSLVVRENGVFNDNEPKSAFINNEIAGSYDDGKIYCGENENKLWMQALSKLNLTVMDVVCDPSDGYKGYGVLGSSSKGVACQDEKDEFLLNKSSESQKQHLEKVVKMKSFPEGIPGGSLTTLTTREKYYVYQDAFLIACATGDGYDTGTDDMYKVNFYDVKTGTISTRYYSRKSKPSTKIYTYGGKQESCQSIVDTISNTANSLHNDDLGEDIENCLGQTNDAKTNLENAVNNLKTIYDLSKSLVAAAEKIIYNNASGREVQLIYGSSIIRRAQESGGSTSIMEFANRASELETHVKMYLQLIDKNIATAEQKEDLMGELDDFKEKAETYKEEIVDKAESISKSLPTYRLGDMQDRGGTWKQSVDGVYETDDSGALKCLAVDNVNGAIAEVNKIAGTTIDFSPYVPVDRRDITEAEREEQLTDSPSPCYDGAGVLGWLLCPIIQSMTGLANDVYDDVEKNYLQIDSQNQLFKDSNIAHSAWKTVRDIANIIFAVVILIVIFSQLTGVGIDNYGIKRILPRLIIAAILVNASWYICKILIDLSNIIGLSIKGFLTASMPSASFGNTSGVFSKASAWTLELGAGVALGVGAIIVSPGILLTAVLGILTIVLGVLFFWLILVAREVAVVLIVILAPLALICYILPNTEKLFKKWVKLFEAMLVLYPICSLCVGGGQFVGGILASAAQSLNGTSSIAVSFASIASSNASTFAAFDSGTGFALAAMIVQVLPFFFIPVLLKGSLAGLGNIGAKLSGLGSKLGRGATNKIRNTDAFKDKQLRMNAGYDKDGKQTRFGQLRANTIGKTRFGQRRMGKYEAMYAKDRQERKTAELLNDPEYMKAKFAAQDSAMNKEKLEAEMSNMKNDTGNYNPATMKRMLREHMEGKHGALTDERGEVTAAGLRARALMKKMSTSGGLSQKDMTSVFAQAGARDENGNLIHDQISSDNLKFAAKFMQSDSDVHKAMASKDTATTQFLRDINSNAYAGIGFADADGNAVDLSQMTREEWVRSHLAEDGELRSGNNNLDFVLDKVIDKDTDLAAQSDGAVREAVNRLVSRGDTSRLEGIYNNDILYNSLTDGAKASISSAIGKPKVKTTSANDASGTPSGPIIIPGTPSNPPRETIRTSFTYETSDGRRFDVTPGQGGVPSDVNSKNFREWYNDTHSDKI